MTFIDHVAGNGDEWVPEQLGCPICGLEACEEHLPVAPRQRATHAVDVFSKARAEAYIRERARREAHRQLDREARGAIQLPEFVSLRTALTQRRPQLEWRIEQWQPRRANVMLTAQFKAGKTTLIGNLIRSLLDGDSFLGEHAVVPLTGTVVLIDTEMSQATLEAWLAAQRISADDRIIPLALKGSIASFDLLDDEVRAAWAARLRDYHAEYLVLDNVRPVLDVHGLDEHRDAGRVLVALDSLLRDAAIGESCVVHHMGHTGERARGDSRLRDWPDVEWRVVRQDENPASTRYISAYGRDVEIAESQLIYDRPSRRLTMEAGTRKDSLLRDDLGRIRLVVNSSEQPLSGRQIKDKLAGLVGQKRVDAALKFGVETEILEAAPGPKRAICYRRRASVSVSQSVSSSLATLARE